MGMLCATDFADAFPTLILTVVLTCQIGTASVERSFSTVNRLGTTFRQRLTSEHTDDLMIIVTKGQS
jgi:hAT family C-terminal dimerisation region